MSDGEMAFQARGCSSSGCGIFISRSSLIRIGKYGDTRQLAALQKLE